MSFKSSLALMSLVLMGGCSAIGNALYPDDANSLSGAGTIVVATSDGTTSKSTQSGMEEIDLAKLLALYGLDDPKKVAQDIGADGNKASLKFRRNDLQNRIIAASNQRCETYVRALIDSRAQTQTNWTSMTALLSGAATVVTPASLAKVFAAGATASTGIVGAYNQAYFNNLTINVITAGIDKQRTAVFQNIVTNQAKEMTDYTIQAAVADAVAYHAACNIVAGMTTASQATAQTDPSTLQDSAAAKR